MGSSRQQVSPYHREELRDEESFYSPSIRGMITQWLSRCGPRTSSIISPGNLPEMQITWPCPRGAAADALRVEASHRGFLSPSGFRGPLNFDNWCARGSGFSLSAEFMPTSWSKAVHSVLLKIRVHLMVPKRSFKDSRPLEV